MPEGIEDLVTHRYRDGVKWAIPQTRGGLATFLSAGTRLRIGYVDIRDDELEAHEATRVVHRATPGSIKFQDGSVIGFGHGSHFEFGPFGFRVEHPNRTYWFRYVGIDEALARNDAEGGATAGVSTSRG